MENNDKTSQKVSVQQKLSPIVILKEAIIVYTKKPKLLIFTSLASLPLFCFLFYFEKLLLDLMVMISDTLQRQDLSEEQYYDLPTPLELPRFGQNFAYRLVQLCSLYLIPLPLLELGTVLAIVGPASKIHNQTEVVSVDTEPTSFRGVFVTYVYAFLLSTCALVALTWSVFLYFVVPRFYSWELISPILFGLAIGSALKGYLVYKRLWLMSVVVSVTEGVFGAEAIVLSGRFKKGNERCGSILMSYFFLFGVGLRIPCLVFGCFATELWFFAQISLLCLGNVVQWIAMVVYCHECKNIYLEKFEV